MAEGFKGSFTPSPDDRKHAIQGRAMRVDKDRKHGKNTEREALVKRVIEKTRRRKQKYY